MLAGPSPTFMSSVYAG